MSARTRRSASAAMRNMAIYQDKVFVATTDARLVALDARTGKKSGTRRSPIARRAMRTPAGPIVDQGQRHQGPGRLRSVRQRRLLHQRATTPRPASRCGSSTPSHAAVEPGGDTWGKLADNLRIGGETWITGSYDPELNLTYWGVAQAKPWMRASRGTAIFDDVLYTSSTVALNPDDGKLAWHYQHVARRIARSRRSVRARARRRRRPEAVFTIGKAGILWKLDRNTGKYLGAQGNGLSERLRPHRSEDRQAALSRRHHRAEDRPVDPGVPEHRRRPQLAGDELQPAERRCSSFRSASRAWR